MKAVILHQALNNHDHLRKMRLTFVIQPTVTEMKTRKSYKEKSENVSLKSKEESMLLAQKLNEVKLKIAGIFLLSYSSIFF